MTTAILHSIKQGAYVAIALYVVFIAVVTVTSMNTTSIHSINAAISSTAVDAQPSAVPVQDRAS
ncbi:hypothetical protein RHM65_13740 [Pseudomonas sp. CCI4.2]|uniref:hypothetical protein n=1 Tax=Pseudomonas sp. CCI4.2 TaxID=3048620 RepID=UPI002AC8975A|nr:hypothetical protein [Pseudomonas sp. CCI4.2]MEB0090316.1 hypothetical protein [Pseudomonas sp. CCI4.2]WPX51916.1 hypothetical protein RHM65_13740 [Pseudomonas sp. CCI4.2]